MQARVLAALALAPPVLAATWFGTPWFEALLALGLALGLGEWRGMVRHGVPAGRRPFWYLGGLVYLAVPVVALWWLRQAPAAGVWSIYWLFAVVWACDSAAYLVGRRLGGAKLWPSVSPNKTWSGAVGGALAGTIVGAAVAWTADLGRLDFLAIVSFVLAVFAIGGDLLESALKRRFGVKDAGVLIPGHGGLLDRVDSLMAAATALAVLQTVMERGLHG